MSKFPLLRAGQGMEITLAGNCIEFSSTVAPPIVAEITGTSGTNAAGATKYTWREMSVNKTGSVYEPTRGGRTGTGAANPAYELNDAPAEAGTIVLLRVRGSGTESQGQAVYEFSLGGGGTTVKVVRVIADWSAFPQYTPVQVTGIGWLYFAYVLSDLGGAYSVDAWVLPTAGETPGALRSTVLRDLGDYIGVQTSINYLEKPIFLVPNTYLATYIPYSFTCGDNGLEITYQQLRIPNAISLGFVSP